MSPKTHAGGIPTTPTPVSAEPVSAPSVGSHSFITIISTILGIVLSTLAIVGFVGKYFYVDRAEYTQKNLQDVAERGDVQRALLKVESTMSQQASTLDRQEKAFDRLSEIVRGIELGSRGRR